MPIVQVNMLEGRTVEQKRAMVAAITAAIVDTLGAPRDSVRVMIHEMQPEHYSVGGITVGERPLGQRKSPDASGGKG